SSSLGERASRLDLSAARSLFRREADDVEGHESAAGTYLESQDHGLERSAVERYVVDAPLPCRDLDPHQSLALPRNHGALHLQRLSVFGREATDCSLQLVDLSCRIRPGFAHDTCNGVSPVRS